MTKNRLNKNNNDFEKILALRQNPKGFQNSFTENSVKSFKTQLYFIFIFGSFCFLTSETNKKEKEFFTVF